MDSMEIRHRILAKPEEQSFRDGDLRLYHENITNDRLVFLPAFREATFGVLDKHLNKKKLKVALEVGCGTGFFSRFLAPDWVREKLISFDVSSLSLKALKEKESSAIFQGSIYSLPLKNKSIDAVIGYSSFDSFIWLSQALKEAKRVLKPGGKLILLQDLTTELYEIDNCTEEDRAASFEIYHKTLVEEAKKADLIILEGENDLIKILKVEKMSNIRLRVPDFELPDRTIPLMAKWDKGFLLPVTTTRSREQTGLSKEKIINDMDTLCERCQKEGLFNKSGAKAGDILTFLTMRYLVGEKPIA
jgi:SAM-dependent methyltransferase